jgi:hypothetical protein
VPTPCVIGGNAGKEETRAPVGRIILRVARSQTSYFEPARRTLLPSLAWNNGEIFPFMSQPKSEISGLMN